MDKCTAWALCLDFCGWHGGVELWCEMGFTCKMPGAHQPRDDGFRV